MNIKKTLFHWITLQKRNALGGFLESFSRTIHHALENKMNDNELSGEYKIWEVLKNQEMKVIFDVGANVGNWSKTINGYKKHAEIHAFEPVNKTYLQLLKNTSEIRNIIPNSFALSDKVEKLEFNFYPEGSYFSSIYDNQLGRKAEKITIDCIKGDDYCLKNNIQQIDFLKIDTEGSEHKVLKGFTKMLEENRVKIIQFEYGDMCIDSGFLLKDYFQLLQGYGFVIGKVYPEWVEFKPYCKKMENFILSNFLAIHQSNKSLLKVFNF